MKRKFTLLTAVLMLLAFLAQPIGMMGQDRTSVTDTLTRASTGVTSTSYVAWSGVTCSSDAVYAGQSAGGNNSIQLRSSNNNSGIITTSSGGIVTGISVTWNSNTASGRTLNIYGSNSAYSSPTELYNSSTQGTLLGTIVNGTSTSLSIDGSYAYIGMRSANAAMWLEKIEITWSTGGGSQQQTVATPTFTPAEGTYSETQYVAIECATQGADIYYTTDGTTPTPNSTPFTEAIAISQTTTLKAIAVKQGMNNSNVATATYTIQEMPTITTIAGLWDFAESVGSSTPNQPNANVTFNNWYVTGVKGSQACISDGQYGFVIYQSGHGFTPGDKLNGTLACKVLLYQNHYAEIMGVKATDLTVTPAQEMPMLTTTIGALTTRNYATPINLGTLTYDGTKFNDETGAPITPYNNFNINPNPIDNLESDKQYNVKGVYIIYWNNSGATQQVAPRSADDFEEVTAPTPTETVATPTFLPAGGTYYETQYVVIECSTQDADIYYTTDGTTPTPNSTPFTEAIAISETTTMKAIAVKDGMLDSEIATAQYVINILPPAQETSYTLITHANALISGDKYIIVGANNDVYKALGKQTNNNRSAVAVTPSNDTVTITPANQPGMDAVYEITLGQDNGNWTLFSAADSGYLYAASSSSNWLRTQAQNDANGQWTIEIAADGKATIIAQGTNTRNQLKYNSGNSIFSCYASTSTQLDVYLYKAGDVPTPPAPTYYSVGVNFNDGGTISVEPEQALENDTIRVTVAPLPGYALSSLTYSYTGANPIDIMGTEWFLMPASDVTVNAVFSEVPHVATPTFTPAEGSYNSAQTVTIACATEGATIYYTMDGTDPFVAPTGVNGTQYSQAIVIGETTTLKAIAVKEGMMTSEIASATYIIQIPSLVFNKLYYHSDVTDEGIYMIVDVNGGYALTSAKGTSASPTADSILVENNAIVGNIAETLQWRIKAVEGGYQISPVNDSTAYLYTTNSNSGVRVGSSTNNVWELGITDAGKPNYHGFKNVAFNRYLGVYSNQDWRTYTSIHNNIANTQIEIFVLGTAPVHTFYPVNVAAVANGTVTVSDSVAEAGTVITVTAEPASGFELATLTYSVTGANPVAIDQTTMQFTMPAAAVTVSATFTELAHVANPTFTPAAGSFITAQTVSIACATDGAAIYYTLDGTDPTPNSPIYSEPFEVAATTTVKAIAVKEGMNNSDVVSVTYTIIDPMSIAEAKSLANNEYALVQGVVIFIDGRNIYVQDETAGIDLYLNNNTVPSNFAIGDMVLGYGKKTVYNGLVELTGINGADANQFVVLSSNNPLPLAVKTVAEILADHNGDKMLQSTRVQIVNATIGTINTANNTPITQDGNTINIYKMPVVEGLEQGDYVTVTGIIGCYNNPQLRVNSAADVEFTHPAGITITPASLSGFNYVYEEGPSTAKSFVIAARSLAATTYIIAPESYELSSFPGDGFHPQSQVTINTYTGTYNYTIKVRLKAGLEVGTYDESIMICEEELDTIYLALSGSVTDAPQPTADYIRVSELSQIGNGAKVIFAARYNENANEYFAMTAQASGKPEGVLFTSVAGTNAETLPSEIVDAEDTYYWTVTTDGTNYTFTNANGDVLGYTSSTNFATGGDNTNWTITLNTSEATAMVPEYTAFNIINGNVTNRAFALNNNHNYGAYHTQNMAGENYNFFIDMFATGGGTVTPTCATPTFDPVGGTYFEEQTVTITCSTADATIYYTLDGTDPTPNSLVYTEPIEVAESMTIKAYAVKEGCNDSNIAEAEYTIILGAVTIFFQDWEGEMNGWTFVSVEGNKPWTIGQYQGNHYANANGYNGGANEQWCISPAFSLEQYSDVSLSFLNAMNYTGPELQLFFSNDYDGVNPPDATWTELDFEMSTGSYTWVESGVISLADFTGSECYIGFKYTSTDDAAAAWEVDDILLMGYTSDPYLNVTPNALSGFTYTVENGPSAAQTFTVSGANLPPAPGGSSGGVTITCNNSHYEFSLDGEEYWHNLGIEVVGTLEPTTVYVRLEEGLPVGQWDGVVTLEDGGTTATVTLSGTVTEPIQGGDWNRIGSLADLHDGDQIVIAARYDASVGNGYYAMTAGVSGKPEGVLFTSVNEDGVESLPDEIVAEIETFAWNVTVNDTIITLTNAAGDVLGYSSSTNFAGNTNTEWAITMANAGDNTIIPGYSGFVITNMTTTNRGIAKNNNNNYGAYSTSNINNGDYNFYLDLFVLGGSATQVVATPVFSVASGTYFEEFDVEITCATEGATIYYTTDGSDPTAESMVYEEPIHVDADVTLKAIAMMEGYENSNVATANYVVMTGQVVILQQDWEGEMNGWTFVTVEGNKPWNIATYGGNKYASANGYNDDTDNEQWCISPAFDLTYYTDVVLTFRNAMKYTGPDMQLMFSSNYDGEDPTTATWTELEYVKSEGNYTWTESGEISLDGLRGENCYLAFLYTSTLEEGAAAWEVDDILVLGTAYDAVEETTVTDVNFWNFGNEIFFDNQTNGNVQMVVFNMLGQQVYAKTLGTGSTRFSHNLAAGLYVVTLQNSKGRMAVKMIVK